MTQAPDRPAPSPAPEGTGLPPNPDPAAEARKRDIEREVYARRTAADKDAENQQSRPSAPLGKA
jgi:hypothetical protein